MPLSKVWTGKTVWFREMSFYFGWLAVLYIQKAKIISERCNWKMLLVWLIIKLLELLFSVILPFSVAS